MNGYCVEGGPWGETLSIEVADGLHRSIARIGKAAAGKAVMRQPFKRGRRDWKAAA